MRSDASLLIRGRLLKEAVRQADANPTFVSVNSVPAYLARCEQSERNRLRTWLVLSVAAFLITGFLALAALYQRDIAIRNERIATAQALAAQSNEIRAKAPQPGLLLASEAVKTTVSLREPVVPAAEQALRDSLAALGGLVLRGHTGPVTRVATSPDSRWAVTASEDTTARVWDLQARDPAATSGVLAGHAGEIRDLVISGDGKCVVTADSKAEIRVWDLPVARSGAARFVLPKAGGDLNAVAISRDGQWVVAASSSGVNVWDLKGAEPTKPLTLGTEAASSIAIAADGHRVVTGHFDGVIKVWALPAPRDAVASRVYASPRDSFSDKPISVVTLSDDGHWLLTGNVGGTVRLWDFPNVRRTSPVAELKQEGVPQHDGDFRISSLSMNQQKGRIAAVQRNGRVRLYQLTRNNTVTSTGSLQQPGEAVGGAMSANGQWLLVGGEHGDARLLPLDENASEPRALLLRGHESFVNSTAFTKDNNWAITGGSDDTARLWRMEPAAPSAQPVALVGISEAGSNAIDIAAISSDVATIVVNGDGGDLRIFRLDAEFPESLTRLYGQASLFAGVPGAASFSSNAQALVTGDRLGAVKLWNLGNAGNDLSELSIGALDGNVAVLAVSPDRRFVAAGPRTGPLQVWDLTNPEPGGKPRKFSDVSDLGAAAISPDNRWVVTAGDTVLIQGIAAENTSRKEISGRDPGLRGASATFSSDGRKLAVAFGQEPGTTTFVGSHVLPQAGMVKVWDVGLRGAQNDPLALPVSGASLTSVAFSPHGRWLAAGGSDGNVRLWDLRSATEPERFIVLRGGDARVLAVAVTSDEKHVVAISTDKVVRLWKLQVGDLLDLASRHLARNLTGAEWNTFQQGRSPTLTFPELGSPSQSVGTPLILR